MHLVTPPNPRLWGSSPPSAKLSDPGTEGSLSAVFSDIARGRGALVAVKDLLAALVPRPDASDSDLIELCGEVFGFRVVVAH